MPNKDSKRSRTAGAALLTVLVVALLAIAPMESASATPKIVGPKVATVKTWDIAKDFAANPKLNPAPDQYGDPGVWSWMYGSTNSPGSYTLSGYQSPGTTKANCGAKQYAWGDPTSETTVEDPTLLYQTDTIPAGSDSCAPRDTFKKDTITTSPGWSGDDTAGLDMVVGWKSPIKGDVSVSGKIKGIDPDESGITWELDQGTTVLAGPTVQSGDAVSSIGPLSVSMKKGQSLYLEIADGPSGGGGADEALTAFTITS